MFQEDFMVTIALEGSQRTFQVQRALLCGASDYFQKALTGQFNETNGRTLKLPGCDEDTFELVLYWLVHKMLPESVKSINTSDVDVETKHQLVSTRQELFIKAWRFGQACLMPKLQNQAMTSLLAILEPWYVRPKAIEVAIDTTGIDSVLSVMLLDEAVWDLYDGAYSSEEMDIFGAIPGFLAALVERTEQCGERNRTQATRQDHQQFMVPEEAELK